MKSSANRELSSSPLQLTHHTDMRSILHDFRFSYPPRNDMQYVWPYMLDTYEKDIKFLKDIEGLYQRGG